MNESFSTVVPAYGRDYKSKKAILEDLMADKDFVICDIMCPWDGKPVNLSQIREAGIGAFNVRYGRMRKVCRVTVGANGKVK